MQGQRSTRRDRRQANVLAWARSTFGDVAIIPAERALRLLEEALELAQATGLPIEEAERLARYVYDKPPGTSSQEVGGIAVCLLAYCEAAGISAETEEAREVARVLALPAVYYRERQNRKAAAGVALRCEP